MVAEMVLGEIGLGENALGKIALGEFALGETALGEIAIRRSVATPFHALFIHNTLYVYNFCNLMKCKNTAFFIYYFKNGLICICKAVASRDFHEARKHTEN